MIDLIKRLVGVSDGAVEATGGKTDQARADRSVHLAACAIFLEMAHIDDVFDEREREFILDVFQNEYGLSAVEVAQLQRESADELGKSINLWRFTSVINEHYSTEEKTRLVELLWRLVYADGKLDDHEDYLMHTLAKLLRLTHRELMNAKLKVLYPEKKPGGG